MSTKETLGRLSCFNDWKEICEGLDTAATYAPSTDRYYIKEAILHIEGMQSIADELAYHVKQLEKENEELCGQIPVYCEVCGACGEDGCCPSKMCKCLYSEEYKHQIILDNEVLQEQIAELQEQLKLQDKAARDLIDFELLTEYEDRITPPTDKGECNE